LAEQFFGKKCKTLTLDLWGHGKSAEPAAGFGVYEYAAALTELLKKLEVENTVLIAHSFGGRVAIIIAAKHPELVDKLVLVDSAGIKPRFSIIKRAKQLHFKFVRALYKRGVVRNFDEGRYGSADYKKLSEGMRQNFVKIINTCLACELPKINAETLIIWGGSDYDTPMYMAKKLYKGIRRSKLVVFEQAGHYSYLDSSDKFLSAVDGFIS